MAAEKEPFEGWAIVELMGHRRLAGYVREVEIAGAGMLRLDVPGEKEGETVATRFYSPSALYCLTPTTEETARAVARGANPAPVQRWELPAPAKEGDSPRAAELDDEPAADDGRPF